MPAVYQLMEQHDGVSDIGEGGKGEVVKWSSDRVVEWLSDRVVEWSSYWGTRGHPHSAINNTCLIVTRVLIKWSWNSPFFRQKHGFSNTNARQN